MAHSIDPFLNKAIMHAMALSTDLFVSWAIIHAIAHWTGLSVRSDAITHAEMALSKLFVSKVITHAMALSMAALLKIHSIAYLTVLSMDTLDMLDIAVEGTFPISLWDSMVDGLNVDSADVYWDSDVKELAPDTEE
eukprot:9684122-Ditylum_brightwellii.AAC.1